MKDAKQELSEATLEQAAGGAAVVGPDGAPAIAEGGTRPLGDGSDWNPQHPTPDDVFRPPQPDPDKVQLGDMSGRN